MASTILNDVRLHYDIVGTGETIVLTHGSWGDGAGWQPTVDILAEHYRVVTWDRRGHSRSDNGLTQGVIADDVNDLAALIEHVATEPVHVVGNSFGSVISYRLVVDRPELLKSAAVHEPAALALLSESDDPEVKAVADPFFKELYTVKSLLEQGRNRDAPAHFMDYVAFGPGTWASFPEESMQALEANAPTFLEELQEHPYGQLDVDALAKSEIPLLLTVGTESPEFLKLIVKILVDHAPSLQVEWIQGSGHVPHATHPEAWSKVLMDFWRST